MIQIENANPPCFILETLADHRALYFALDSLTRASCVWSINRRRQHQAENLQAKLDARSIDWCTPTAIKGENETHVALQALNKVASRKDDSWLGAQSGLMLEEMACRNSVNDQVHQLAPGRLAVQSALF